MHAKVVIIGGGVVGCSVAYHLTKKGWDGVVLCEQNELATGATAFAIGHVILYTLDATISRLNQYGVDLYPQLETETGFSPGMHRCGNLRIATESNRFNEFYRYMNVAAVTDVQARIIDTKEIGELWPLMKTDGLLGGLFNPRDGYASPTDLAQSFAAGARQRGAEIQRHCEVTRIAHLPSGKWEVETNSRVIVCDHVVSCSGNHSRRTARMIGAESHCIPVRHQYVITETVPELVRRREAGLPEMPVFRDPDGSFYMRQEGDALAIGAYDGRGDAKFVDEVPDEYATSPFPDELEKLLPYLERAMQRVPLLETTGIRHVVNYAMPYTPDDLPITGPAFGLKNLWLAEGNPFGITLCGGIGWQLAEWIVEGEPSIDMGSCDPCRFGDWATRKWAARKVEEAYQHTYLIPQPGEELPAGRDLRTSPLHDLLKSNGAVFGVDAGWEYAKWYETPGAPTAEAAIMGECNQASKSAVVADLSHTPRFRVAGTDTPVFLGRILCTRLPEVGKHARGYALGFKGTFHSVFSVFREREDSFLLGGTPKTELRDLDWLVKAVAPDEDVWIDNLTGREGTLLLFGASARNIFAESTGEVLSCGGFPPGTGRTLAVGYAPARAVRVDPFGFDGWELHAPFEVLRHVYQALEGASPIGWLALEALRLEKGEPAPLTELTHDFSPRDARLDHVVSDRPDFYGAREYRAREPAYRLVRFEILSDAAPLSPEPVRDGSGTIVGRTTSGTRQPVTGKALAFGYVETGVPDEGLEVRLMGNWCSCTVVGNQLPDQGLPSEQSVISGPAGGTVSIGDCCETMGVTSE